MKQKLTKELRLNTQNLEVRADEQENKWLLRATQ